MQMYEMAELLSLRVTEDAKRAVNNELEAEYPRLTTELKDQLNRVMSAQRFPVEAALELLSIIRVHYKLEVVLAEKLQLFFDIELCRKLKIAMGKLERGSSADKLAASTFNLIKKRVAQCLDVKFNEIAKVIKQGIKKFEEEEKRSGTKSTWPGTMGRRVSEVTISVTDYAIKKC